VFFAELGKEIIELALAGLALARKRRGPVGELF